MPSLDEFAGEAAARGRRSKVDLLPDEVRDQLIVAFRNGTHSGRTMVAWLQGDPDLPVECRAVTLTMLQKWFHRNGYRYGEAHEQP